jgi:hypothetical protein
MFLHLQNQDRQKDPPQKEKIGAKCMVIERGFEVDYFLRFCGTYFWSRCNTRACFLVIL